MSMAEIHNTIGLIAFGWFVGAGIFQTCLMVQSLVEWLINRRNEWRK